MTVRMEICILEDNADRREAMSARLQDRFPQYPLHFFHRPAEMIDRLRTSLPHTLLISLDHDLDLIPRQDGTLEDPGTGIDVADWLVARSPNCPVIIHSTNLPAAKSMQSRLRQAGWSAKRITPYDDLAWIDAEWMTAVRQALFDSAVATLPAAQEVGAAL